MKENIKNLLEHGNVIIKLRFYKSNKSSTIWIRYPIKGIERIKHNIKSSLLILTFNSLYGILWYRHKNCSFPRLLQYKF